MDEAQRLVERLFAAGEEMPDGLRDEIIALGTTIEPALLALAEDDALFAMDARGEGWTPLHALTLLGAMRSTAAIPRMLDIVASHDLDEYSFSAAFEALEKMGAPALEPCLAAYARLDEDDERRSSLAAIMAGLGVRDERVYRVLVDELEHDPVLVADTFAEYGDPRAIAVMVQALDDDAFADAAVDLAGAIEALGGELTTAQRRKRDEGVEQRRRAFAALDRRRTVETRPGRNEPCHCGSGRKYKKCHLVSDEAERGDDPKERAAPFSRATLDAVVEQLLEAGAGSDGRAARDEFFGTSENATLPEWAQALFLGYLLYGHRDASGRRLIDRFAAQRGRTLGRQERLVVGALVEAWASLFEVTEVIRGVGLRLRDLVGGGSFEVRDRASTLTLDDRDWMFAWLFPVDDHIELIGDLTLVPEPARDAALKAARSGGARRDRGETVAAIWRVLAEAVGDDEDDELFAELRYDAACEPDAADWLERDESERVLAVELFHRTLRTHARMPKPSLHAMMHVIVENQLAEKSVPEARAAMARLCAAGLSRHEALHAVAEVVAAGIGEALRGRRPRDSLAKELDELAPERHRGSAPR